MLRNNAAGQQIKLPGRIWIGLGSVFGQSWARDRYQRPRLETWCINRRKLTQEPDSKAPSSAELQGPRKLLEDPAGNLQFRTGFGPKSGPNKALNIRHGTHKPTHNDSNQHTTIPNDSGPISACFDDNLGCEIAQSNQSQTPAWLTFGAYSMLRNTGKFF